METFPLPDAQRKAADNGSDRELPMEHVTPGASRLRGLRHPRARETQHPLHDPGPAPTGFAPAAG